jgi:membrane-associated protease RseP (regulator of RpoE activity)
LYLLSSPFFRPRPLMKRLQPMTPYRKRLLVWRRMRFRRLYLSGWNRPYLSQNEVVEKLGFTVQDLTEELAAQFGYQELEGVLISKVKPGSPAAFAGLRPGMLILEVNRESVTKVSELVAAFGESVNSKKVLLLVKGIKIQPVTSASLSSNGFRLINMRTAITIGVVLF